MKITTIFIITLFLITNSLVSQNHDHSEENHNHAHVHAKNEIGLSNSAVYFVEEGEYAYGLHLHYIRNISETKFGFGIGFERIFDEHKHNTIGLVGSYYPIKQVSINLSPGITFEDEHPDEIKFALHLESSYDFEINNFHIGPVIGIAYDPEDYHISIGVHIGYGF